MYKLEEIDRRVRLFRQGQRVLDLGGAPGSWALYASKKVGKNGRVLSIDIQGFGIDPLPNLELRVCDVRDLVEEEKSQNAYDVVMSDMAPKTSGYRDQDQYRSFKLVSMATEIAAATLKEGGYFVAKIFQGPDFEEARNNLRPLFQKVRIIRPKAVRSESYEVFLVGEKRKPLDSVESESP